MAEGGYYPLNDNNYDDNDWDDDDDDDDRDGNETGHFIPFSASTPAPVPLEFQLELN